MTVAAGEQQIPLRVALHIFNVSQVYVSLGVVILAVGLMAAAVCAVRRKLDPLLLWFALFALLYGTRLVMHNLPIWQIGGYPNSFARLALGLGYLVPIPAFLFFQTLGLMNRVGRTLVLFVSPVLVLLSVLTLILGPKHLLSQINNSLVTIALVVLLIDLAVSRDRSPDALLIRRSLSFFICIAVYENLTEFVSIPFYNVEPFGFLVLLTALGTVAARLTFAREQQLTVIQKELQIAQEIQLSILPTSFPASRHFRVAACYRPMTTVAGDLYEYLVAGDDEAGLLIGDVSGHGVPAALIASMVKLAATTQRSVAADPAAVLKGMNEALCGNTQQQFVTAGYVHLHAKTQELRYAAAAHPALLLLRKGETTQIEENGLMLALFSFASYSTKALRLHAGDRVVLYTDGLLEAEDSAGNVFGAERLEAAVRTTGGLPVEQAAEQIISKAQQWSPVQTDDLTILVCDYLA